MFEHTMLKQVNKIDKDINKIDITNNVVCFVQYINEFQNF